MPLSFQEIRENAEIPPLAFSTSSRQSAKWAAASGDFDPIHYDNDYAVRYNLPGTIVNGRLKVALLGRLLTSFIGPSGRLKRLAARHQGMDRLWELLTLRGVVTRKYVDGGENLVDLEIWVENPAGERTAVGSATVSLP
ncbi:MAG: MaoC/PaaZ C-terminal domain-containing protein [Desulfobacteria bacterium]